MQGLHAIMVSVDYTDILRLTLPYNRHHFDTVTIVTSNDDRPNVSKLALDNQCFLYGTDAFYEDGADFNKWKALERGIDTFGLRYCGWLCIMDADVLWPKEIDLWPVDPLTRFTKGINPTQNMVPGRIYTPRRRMFPDIPSSIELLPPESMWGVYPIHKNENEFAGYSQIFHTDDAVLPICGNCSLHIDAHPVKGCPMFAWHDTRWRHAGGADSFFQARWNPIYKIRPNFNVLHLGSAGVNWCGRTSRYADNTVHPASSDRKARLQEYMRTRRATMVPGASGPGVEGMYASEKIAGPGNDVV